MSRRPHNLRNNQKPPDDLQKMGALKINASDSRTWTDLPFDLKSDLNASANPHTVNAEITLE